jgi:hypothetical protein
VGAILGLLLVVHVAGGWYFAGRIASDALAATPGTMTPAFDDAQVVSVARDRVTLRRGAVLQASRGVGRRAGVVAVADEQRGQAGPVRRLHEPEPVHPRPVLTVHEDRHGPHRGLQPRHEPRGCAGDGDGAGLEPERRRRVPE